MQNCDTISFPLWPQAMHLLIVVICLPGIFMHLADKFKLILTFWISMTAPKYHSKSLLFYFLQEFWIDYMGADKSSARPTSRCHRMESIVSLERGVCSMCWIASLFLLHRLKGSMSGDACDFNSIETRAVIKFNFPCKGRRRRKFTPLKEHAPSYATVKNWVAQFKRDDCSTCNALRPGWPKRVITPEIIDQIHELIL